MPYLDPKLHEPVFVPETHQLGVVLWHLLKSAQAWRRATLLDVREGAFTRTETTAFGREVGRDEIHWWVFKKENDLDVLRERTTLALASADRLKAAAANRKGQPHESYESLLGSLREFAETHQADIRELRDYLAWLRERDPLAPSILFTYRVWGSTRRGDRWVEIHADTPDAEGEVALKTLTEIALGLRRGSVQQYTYDWAHYEVGADIYDSDPHSEDEINPPEDEVVRRASWRVQDEFASFFEWIRNSLRNVLLDIDKCLAHRKLLSSDAFWRQFIQIAIKSKKQETQLWDFKETLTMWHVAADAKSAAKTTFAEEVACLANASGGVLIVGVTDGREIVGISGDVESRLKFARDVLAERLEYPRELVSFVQVTATGATGAQVPCLVVVVAKAAEPVGVNDGTGKFTYPVRRETGLERVSRLDIAGSKAHVKSEDHEFMDNLEQFVRENSK